MEDGVLFWTVTFLAVLPLPLINLIRFLIKLKHKTVPADPAK